MLFKQVLKNLENHLTRLSPPNKTHQPPMLLGLKLQKQLFLLQGRGKCLVGPFLWRLNVETFEKHQDTRNWFFV